MLRLFGTSGIRGDAKTFFTDQFSFDIGRTFARFLDKHEQIGTVAVGMDPRPSGQRIKQCFSEGLMYEKRKVLDEGVVPAPAMNWFLMATDAAGTALISGSHIKADMNGIKFFAFKEEILKSHEEEIKKIYQSLKETVIPPAKTTVLPEDKTAFVSYREMLLKLATTLYPKWRVVVDPGNGAQTKMIPDVLRRLGLEVVLLNADLSASFIARDTEVEGSCQELSQKVVEERADLGIAFDADGDRVVFVDEEGVFIPGDYTGALLAKHGDTRFIVTPINTSQVVEYLGKPVIRTRVGSPFVVAKMKEVGATFGFEANGGGFSAEIMMSRDGGSTAIKILNLMKTAGKSLRELISELPRFYLYRTKVDCPKEKNGLVLKQIKERFTGVKTEELGGLKVWLDQSSWVLFRPSSNAPEFRVFAEAKSQQEATKLGEEGIQLVKTALNP